MAPLHRWTQKVLPCVERRCARRRWRVRWCPRASLESYRRSPSLYSANIGRTLSAEGEGMLDVFQVGLAAFSDMSMDRTQALFLLVKYGSQLKPFPMTPNYFRVLKWRSKTRKSLTPAITNLSHLPMSDQLPWRNVVLPPSDTWHIDRPLARHTPNTDSLNTEHGKQSGRPRALMRCDSPLLQKCAGLMRSLRLCCRLNGSL